MPGSERKLFCTNFNLLFLTIYTNWKFLKSLASCTDDGNTTVDISEDENDLNHATDKDKIVHEIQRKMKSIIFESSNEFELALYAQLQPNKDMRFMHNCNQTRTESKIFCKNT